MRKVLVERWERPDCGLRAPAWSRPARAKSAILALAGAAFVAFCIRGRAESANRTDAWSEAAALCRQFPLRGVGQPGNRSLGDYIAQEFASRAPQSGVMTFRHPVLTPAEGTLEVGGRRLRLLPLQPNLADPGNLPDGHWNGRLVYVGKGDTEALENRPIPGAAAVMEFNCGWNWLEVVRAGAAAVIFLESPDTSGFQARQKRVDAPICIPRFLLRRADADALRRMFSERGAALDARMTCPPRRWVQQTLKDYWAVVPGTSKPQEVVHFQVALDSAAICPGADGGAESAANLAIFLRIFRRVASRPLGRTVVFSVVNAHRTGMAGARVYTWTLFAPEDALAEEREALEKELEIENAYVAAYSRPVTAELVEEIRRTTTSVGGKTIELRKPIQELLTTRLNRGRQEIARLQQQMRRIRTGRAVAGCEARIAELREHGSLLVRLLGLFNKFGRRTRFEDLTSEERRALEAAFRDVVELHRTAARSIEADLAESRANRRLRDLLGDCETMLYCFLDCSFHNDRIGFFNQSTYQTADYTDLQKNVVKFSRDSLRLAASVSEEYDIPNLLEDTILNNAGVPWQNHLADAAVTPTLFGNQALVPSVALLTTDDLRRLRYTTLDDIRRLPRENVNRIARFLEVYLPELFDHGLLKRGYRLRGRNLAASIRLLVRQVDAFSLTVPKQPVPGSVVFVRPSRVLNQGAFWRSVRGDIDMDYPVMSDARGSAVLRMLRRGTGYFSQVFSVDDAGRVCAALDLGRMETRFSSNLGSSLAVSERIVAVFPCVKYDLVGLIEPLSFEPVRRIDVIDALQESTPLSFGLSGVAPAAGATKKRLHTVAGAVASIFVPPGLPFKLRLGHGLLLNSSMEEPTGAGYGENEMPVDALRFAVARDTWTLDEYRTQRLERRGVYNALARDLHDLAGKMLEHARELRKSGRIQLFLNRVTEALGVEYRAYPAILSTINDMVKGVVIFLGLVIPFSYFAMKLTCVYTEISRQLIWFAGLFAVTFLWLRMVHPVFGLTHAPTIVLIAFVMLGLALFVSWILYARFDEEMTKVLNQFTDADSAEAPRSRLAGVAFSVGVNNMKRRRIRTSLTCATVILVTFTMLSFTSVTENVRSARARLGTEAPYNGFVYANPGFAPLDDSAARCLRALFAEKGQVVQRVWAQRLNRYGGYMPYPLQAPDGRTFDAKVLLGLEPAEDGFLTSMPLVAGRWLSSDDAAEIVLSATGASFVGITPENLDHARLRINGMDVPVVGLVDDARLEAVRDIGGVPLLPLEQTASLATAQRSAQQTMQQASAKAASGSPLAGSSPLSARDIAITSIGFARMLGGASVRMLCVKHESAAVAWREANRVMRFCSSRLLLGLRGNVRLGKGSAMLRAGAYGLLPIVGRRVGGLARIVVPLIIGATIILNTMLGAVMERKREISIYNAIGLNPTHVAVFFLSESLVFGIIGAAAGYLIGQSLSRIIVRLGWMSAVNMNYSSLSVVMVIFLAILTVLLSSIYPAILATRAAVPSGKRKWSLPVPEGDEIRVDFPFSYDPDRVLAVLAYLYSYFELNSEASSGRFVAELLGLGRTRSADDSVHDYPVWVMVYNVSLAPFDLGVNERVEIYAYFDPVVGAYRITMHMTRLTGEVSNWKTCNQPFLEALRKHLLRWRSQNERAQQRCYEHGERLFGDAPTLA